MSSYIDDEVRRIAQGDAEKFFLQGHTIEEAAEMACTGHWSYQRDRVKAQLQENCRRNASTLTQGMQALRPLATGEPQRVLSTRAA